jgi:hypothetical protein
MFGIIKWNYYKKNLLLINGLYTSDQREWYASDVTINIFYVPGSLTLKKLQINLKLQCKHKSSIFRMTSLAIAALILRTGIRTLLKLFKL